MARDERDINELHGKDLTRRLIKTLIPVSISIASFILAAVGDAPILLIGAAGWAVYAYKFFFYGIE